MQFGSGKRINRWNEKKMKIATTGIAILLAGCAASTSQRMAYWQENKGVVIVHHIVGNQDQMEKLVSDKVKSPELGSGKYSKVATATVIFHPSAPQQHHAEPDKLSARVDELSKRLAVVEAQKKQLENQVKSKVSIPENQSTSERNAEAEATPAAVSDVPEWHLSQ